MDALVVIKDCLINMIDNCESRGTCHETLRQLTYYFELFVVKNYAYKGVELCNRMLMVGGWGEDFRQEIVNLRSRYEAAQSGW